MGYSPHTGVWLAVTGLALVVQLGEEGEQDLDAPYRVQRSGDGVGHRGSDVLGARGRERAITLVYLRGSVCMCALLVHARVGSSLTDLQHECVR